MSHRSGSRPLVSGTHHHPWILTGTPLGYPVAATSLRDFAGIVPQVQSLHELQQVLAGVDVRVCQPKAWLWASMVAKLVSPGSWGHPPQSKGWSQLPYMYALGVSSPWPVVWGGDHLSRVQGPLLLLKFPARGKASFPRASERHGWLNMAL